MQQTPRMPSNQPHTFSNVPSVHVPRSVFRRPYERHMTNGCDYLYPFYVEEVIPGDTHMLKGRFVSRLTTPIVPFMSNLYLETFFFFIPNRLVWEHWENFMGARTPDPDSSIDYTLPLMYRPSSGGWDAFSLQDYLNYGNPGVDGDDTSTYAAHNLVGRAYNLVYNDFFRDQNLIDSAVVDLDDGPDAVGDYVLRKRGKRHDYFTSALPWPQKGEAVPLVISGEAPVYGRPISYVSGDFTTHYNLYQSNLSSGGAIEYGALRRQASTANPAFQASDTPGGGQTSDWNNTSGNQGMLSLATEDQYASYNDSATGSEALPPYADLASVDSGTINDFRFAFQLQMLLENDARGGTRYIELLLVQYGVVSPDYRIQRPEYLGGGRQELNMITVPQTSETNTTEQGNLAAYALFNGGSHGFRKSFVEHGYIIGLLNVRTDLSYQQGQPRHYGRRTRYDYYFPAFAHLGEQVVYNREIFETAAPSIDDAGTFGYQEYGAEYRYKSSEVVASMRSDYATSLDVYGLWQQFGSLPELGQTFIEEDVPIERVTGVDTPHEFFKTDFFASIKSVRPLPVYSVPGLVTRL
jgi:hypothetical protein